MCSILSLLLLSFLFFSNSTPETVEFGDQKYRHVDSILINCTSELGNLINLVSGNEKSNFQRAGILYGRYAPDPNFRHGVQAIVEAIYEPPQTVDFTTGAVRLLSDPNAAAVETVSKACGLAPVGWMFTRRQTREKGVELLPHELYAIAAQQLQHYPRATDGKPGSQWVTLTVYKDPKDKQYHLQGYMATDQMMALVRDGVVQQPKPDDLKFKKRELKKDSTGLALPGEMPVPDILSKSKDRGAFRTDTFPPEFGILTMEATGPVAGSATAIAYPPVFKHVGTFPVENREALGIRQTPSSLKKLLSDFSREPMQQRLSEFHALCYLAALTDAHTAVSAAQSVVAGKPLEEGVTVLLEAVTS
jgi:nuclear protein localization protein 4 homolog